jgi:transaldolase
MKTVFYADTANIEQLKKFMSLSLIAGCTTNPSIMAKEGRPYSERVIQEIVNIVQGPVSVELTSEIPEQMLEEARKFYSWNKKYIVVKVPVQNSKGEVQTAIVSQLHKEGIPTNVTCCMNLAQMFAAATAGATYASIFWGRVGDMGYDAEQVTRDIVEAFRNSGTETKIIIGSIRQVSDLVSSLKTGADILTVPPDTLMKSLHHPRSVETQREFLENYSKISGK